MLVFGLPGMLGEMIEAAVEAQAGLLLVRAPDATDLPFALGTINPHVLIAGAADDRLRPQWLEALHTRPGLRIVTVDRTRGTGVLYEMRPHAVALGEVSPGEIAVTISALPR